MKVLILYFTKTGHTLEAINAVAEGIRSAGSEVDIVNAKEFSPDSLQKYESLIVGSPCWAGSMIKSAGIAGPVKKAIKAIEAGALNGKICGGISVNAGNGGQNTVRNMGKILAEKGCEDYRPGPVAAAGVSMSLWKGPSVTPEDQERYKAYGVEFVK